MPKRALQRQGCKTTWHAQHPAPTVVDWFTAAPDANSVLTTASRPCSLATNSAVAPLPCAHPLRILNTPSAKARLASGRTGGTPSVLFTLAPSSSAALTPPSSPSRAAVISCATEAAPRTSVQRGSIGGDRCSTIAFTNHTPSCSARSPLPCTTVISSQLQAPHQSHTCETTHQRHTNDTPATHNVSSTSPLLHSTTPRSGRKGPHLDSEGIRKFQHLGENSYSSLPRPAGEHE